MWKIVELSNYQDPGYQELPIMKDFDIPVVNRLKKKVWTIIWASYIEEIINMMVKWVFNLKKENLEQNILPYNIVVHLEKTNQEERLKLASLISDNLKRNKSIKNKKQLLFLRNKLLQN